MRTYTVNCLDSRIAVNVILQGFTGFRAHSALVRILLYFGVLRRVLFARAPKFTRWEIRGC